MIEISEDIKLDNRALKAAVKDLVKSARAVDLVYISDQQPGYSRVKRGKSFSYLDGSKKVIDKEELERIRKLVIPPAWENVWICKRSDGHLQATGIDMLKRKQYRYHSLWSKVRNHTKFYRLLEFGNRLPFIRARIENDLSLRGFPQDKVLALVVSLLEQTNIRVGNSFYEKLYGSFGLTTLKNKHVDINGKTLCFTFKGKKGVRHSINLQSKKLAKIVKGCKEIPGKELFEYYDEEGVVRNIDSGMVNQYIQQISEGDFTAKDFRTWSGSVYALIAFKELGGFETETEMKQKIPAALDIVATHLGNTRTVCKKYYVHPTLIDLYQGNKLEKYLKELDKAFKYEKTGLLPEEKVLMKILKP